MAHFNDLRAERLANSGFDSESDWLKSRVAWQSGDPVQINDLWNAYLVQKGYLGSLTDMKYEWFGQSGYDLSDHISDREYAFWSDVDTPLPL